MEFETKIVYSENGLIRAVRGILDEANQPDPDFLIMQRLDGSEVKIARRIVLKIEKHPRTGGRWL